MFSTAHPLALGGTASNKLAVDADLSEASLEDLCVQIAQHQLVEADKLYAAAEIEKAEAILTDVVAFSELARDYAIQSHHYQKQTEIAVRTMARKLADVKHVVAHADEGPIQTAITRLQRVRDDLLAGFFESAH